MTATPRVAEAERAAVAYHLALTRIGAATVEDALRLWAGVPPTRVAATAGLWLQQAITLVLTRRGQARDLAMAYYRLARALRTGRTIADPRRPEPPYATLDQLRREFTSLAGTRVARPVSDQPNATPADSPHRGEGASAPGSHGDEDDTDAEVDRILVEQIAELDSDMARQEQADTDELANALAELGPANLDRKLRDLDPEAPATQVDQARDEAHRQAGARQAAAAERIAMNGGRGTLWSATQRDRRAIGYVRLSRTGTPCGWCAMLISRGVAYKSERSATYADGDKYHDNCHCYAEPVFSTDQFEGSSLTALNRRYMADWPRVTKGLSGKAAVSAWRRFIRTEQAAAQEAR